MTIEEAIAHYIKKYSLPTELNPSEKVNPPFAQQERHRGIEDLNEDNAHELMEDEQKKGGN